MIISEHIEKPIETNYFFISGIINIDFDYFIKKIDEGVKSDNNNNYKTNILGCMTHYQYFLKDNKFLDVNIHFMKYIDENLTIKNYELADAWGYRMCEAERTYLHDHRGCAWSGALYLNSHEQTLDFPEINKKIKPEPGRFVLFSPWLQHEAKRNLEDTRLKYGLSFNANFT